MGLRNALLDAWALVMPVECAGCGDADRALCASCALELAPLVTTRSTPGGLRVVTAVRYEGIARRVLLSFKEEQRTDLAATLAVPLSAALQRAISQRATVSGGSAQLVAVPTSRAAYRRRGYDPVSLLLRKAHHRPVGVLNACRRTSTQKTLGVADRAVNLHGAFAALTDLTGRRFVLVDDILTTGATLDEAARALSAAGGTVLGAAALAFTPRLSPFRDNRTGPDYGGAKGAH